MAKNVLSLEELKRDIDNSLTSVTKCYILLKISYRNNWNYSTIYFNYYDWYSTWKDCIRRCENYF